MDRRNFLIRSAVAGAAVVMTGGPLSAQERTRKSLATLPVLQQSRSGAASFQRPERSQKGSGARDDDGGRVLQSGAGPSSSHTIGPMRITYDFYQRGTKLPADKLAQATKLQVHLFGSLSATGKGHGTERAAWQDW